jgi:hypothetical protein
MEFGQAYCRDLLKRNPRKFSFIFLSFILFSMHFRSFYDFSWNLNKKEFGDYKLMNSSGWLTAQGLTAHSSEGATCWARGGERGLTDRVRLRWGENVGDMAELPQRRRAPVAGGGLWSDLQHGEEA